MKRYVLALATAAALATGAATAANAQDIDVGPGGVHVGPHHYRYDRDRDYRAYDEYRGGCRVVITHGTNRYGEPTTMRRRVCD